MSPATPITAIFMENPLDSAPEQVQARTRRDPRACRAERRLLISPSSRRQIHEPSAKLVDGLRMQESRRISYAGRCVSALLVRLVLRNQTGVVRHPIYGARKSGSSNRRDVGPHQQMARP
jgi:hypothetical protein